MKLFPYSSGEFLVFLIALPAFVSPLLVVPFPDVSPTLVRSLRPLIAVCEYPRAWAFLASVVAGIWVWRAHVAQWRKVLGAGIAALAWIPAVYAGDILTGWARF